MIKMATDLSKTDRRILAALKQDSRLTVTTIAATLNLSRATVKSRMERLVSTGVIKRFTIEIDKSDEPDLVRAVILIQLEGSLTNSVIASLTRLPEIGGIYTTNGNWDLVANIETYSLPEFDRVLRLVREINGVLNSETSILLNRAQAE